MLKKTFLIPAIIVLSLTVAGCSASEPKETTTVDLPSTPSAAPSVTPEPLETAAPVPETPIEEEMFIGNLETLVLYTSNYVDLSQLNTDTATEIILRPSENGSAVKWNFKTNKAGYDYISNQLRTSEGWEEAELVGYGDEDLLGTSRKGLSFEINKTGDNLYTVNIAEIKPATTEEPKE